MDYNVCETGRYDDAIFYRLLCYCGSDDHAIALELERDKELDMLFLRMFTKMEWNVYWEDVNWMTRLYRKVKAAFKLLFYGYIELEEELVINGERHINDFIKALEEGKAYLKSNEGGS